MTFTTESAFEEAVIKMLSEHGWESAVLKNYTEKQLIQNWADILFEKQRDIERMNNCHLQEGEMMKIMEQIEMLK